MEEMDTMDGMKGMNEMSEKVKDGRADWWRREWG